MSCIVTEFIVMCPYFNKYVLLMFHIPFQIKRSDMHQVEYWVGKRLAYFEQTQNEEQKVIQKQRVLRQFEKYLQSKELCKVVPEDVVRF